MQDVNLGIFIPNVIPTNYQLQKLITKVIFIDVIFFCEFF